MPCLKSTSVSFFFTVDLKLNCTEQFGTLFEVLTGF